MDQHWTYNWNNAKFHRRYVYKCTCTSPCTTPHLVCFLSVAGIGWGDRDPARARITGSQHSAGGHHVVVVVINAARTAASDGVPAPEQSRRRTHWPHQFGHAFGRYTWTQQNASSLCRRRNYAITALSCSLGGGWGEETIDNWVIGVDSFVIHAGSA